MEELLSPQKSPYVVELELKDYWWCACGRSQNQPFCDSSHKGTEFKPVKFTVNEKKNTGFVVAKRHLINHFATALIRKFNFFK